MGLSLWGGPLKNPGIKRRETPLRWLTPYKHRISGGPTPPEGWELIPTVKHAEVIIYSSALGVWEYDKDEREDGVLVTLRGANNNSAAPPLNFINIYIATAPANPNDLSVLWPSGTYAAMTATDKVVGDLTFTLGLNRMRWMSPTEIGVGRSIMTQREDWSGNRAVLPPTPVTASLPYNAIGACYQFKGSHKFKSGDQLFIRWPALWRVVA